MNKTFLEARQELEIAMAELWRLRIWRHALFTTKT